MDNIIIIGGGLSGISASFFIGHQKCVLYEEKPYIGGHIYSHRRNGFTWDEGPHVSFTNNAFAKLILEESVGKENLLAYPVSTSNYFEGTWIPHPAQSNLYAVPQPLRDKCLDDFLNSRTSGHGKEIRNYRDWLISAFGESFYDTFPKAYTKKYWTESPENLTTEWVGKRVFYPDVETVKRGYYGSQTEQTHYVKSVRYPSNGGYLAFAKGLSDGIRVNLNLGIEKIDFSLKQIFLKNGTTRRYDQMISTIPLPVLIELSNAPTEIKQFAKKLKCTSLLLINVEANHPTKTEDNWIYVYDMEKYSTRINCTELLSESNAPLGKSGIQVEVYFESREVIIDHEQIAVKVCNELIEMGLVNSKSDIIGYHTKFIPWGNVVFDMRHKEAQGKIFEWLERYGLIREEDDLHPLTDWEYKMPTSFNFGDLILAGRYAQWKYYWTDDCILRGKWISENLP